MSTLLKSLLFCSLLFSTAFAEVALQGKAPELTGINDEGQTVVLADLYKEGYVLVYFYPKAGTPGCTKQACSLRDAYAELEQAKVKVIGVSTDTVEAQKKFKKENRLKFTLIADTDKKWAEAFGVDVNLGFASRQAFLIKEGKFVWIDHEASTEKQAQDVLDFLKTQDAKQGSKAEIKK